MYCGPLQSLCCMLKHIFEHFNTTSFCILLQNIRTKSKNPVLSKMTAYLLAANLTSNYSIRTAYYAVTKKEGPCSSVEIPWSQSRRLPQMHVLQGRRNRGHRPPPQLIVAWIEAKPDPKNSVGLLRCPLRLYNLPMPTALWKH